MLLTLKHYFPYQSSANVYKLGICVISWIEDRFSIQKYCVWQFDGGAVNQLILGFCI